MRRVLFLFAILAIATGTPAGPARAELPPLVDRELFFGDPEITGAELSPDGKYIAFIKPYNDVRNIWVKEREEPFDAAHPVTADERPVPGYFWSQDGRFILYVQDKGGNENYHVYAVDPSAEAEAETGVPPARDLTPMEDVRARIYSVPENRPGEIIVGLNDRDPTYHDVYRVDIATGERELMIENTQGVGFYLFDLEGNVRLAYRQTEDGGGEILRVDGDDLVQIYTHTYLESAFPTRFHKDGKKAYMVTNKGDDVDLTRLVLLDPETGKTELVESDPEGEVDFGGAAFSEKTDELIATVYVGDRQRIYPRNEQVKKDLELIHKELPEGEINIMSSTEDMRYHLISISSDVDPGSAYLYDREKGDFELLYRSRPELPSENLAHMKPIRYKARDGLEIPAYLTLPRGVEAKNLPTVIHPHGGPWARDTWGYNPYAQFLANRGYAVLQPNFRSSSGYGKAFLNAGNKEWGTGAMQHDITDGVKYLIEKGIADPDRIGIFGGSYGGYATLAGVTFTPDLYTCGVPYVAPSNLITLIESFPAYWRPFLKGSWYMRVGDPEIEADREDLMARSPINFVDNIKVPLLVLHGANDPRVKQRESDEIVAALRDKGQDVEYLVAPDEGHGFRAPENRMAAAAAMEEFLAKHLGGRYQKEMTDEVATRLQEITVDPASVTLPDEAEVAMAEKAKMAPLPKSDGSRLEPASMKYSASMDMMGDTIEMQMTREIEEAMAAGRKCWRVTERVETPMGTSVDAFDVDRRTLEPVQREASGMGSMKLMYTHDAVKGEMGAQGRMMEVDVPLEAPVLGDGPGLIAVLAGLPLEVGYETTYRVFEPMAQKVRPMKLAVTGKEKTEVEGGSYETYVVEITPLDDEEGGGGAMRVMQETPHHVVKAEFKLPAMMGGGMFRSELSAVSVGVETGSR
jgi:dipeptidyl aminopeptidase/acylaminoacyl peptidase